MIPARATPARAGTLLVLGDSLSAGYGLQPGQGWVDLLEKKLRSQGYEYRLVNASVSGETTSGGLERLPRALALQKPAVVIVELGANDGLRGLPVTLTRQNLLSIVALVHAAHARVLLIGMKLPPNYGPRFTAEFDALFPDIANREHVALVPFLLQAVANERRLFQADGLHPTAQAQPALLDTVWPRLRPLLNP